MINFEFLENRVDKANKPDLKPFSPFTLMGPFSLNGYVVIPDNWTLDYYDEFYQKIDDAPFGGLTFGGYIYEMDGSLHLTYLDANPFNEKQAYTKAQRDLIDKMKSKCVKAIGFDDNHIVPNQMSAADGSQYLVKQLKELWLGTEVEK